MTNTDHMRSGPTAPSLKNLASHLLAEMHARGAAVNLTGGLGISFACPRTERAPFNRQHHDIDLCTRFSSVPSVESVLLGNGWLADARFNALNAGRQLRFTSGEIWLDIFVDFLRMCHNLDLRKRVDTKYLSLPVADLLLGKLQIVELNEKDKYDICALLLDHDLVPSPDRSAGIELERVTGVCGSDWGWFQTSLSTLAVVEAWSSSALNATDAQRVGDRVHELRDALTAAPKTMRWKIRGMVGERVRWYELPEEVAMPEDVAQVRQSPSGAAT